MLTILLVGGVMLSFETFAAMSYLDNGVVKVGVDLAKGASITYLSVSGTSSNVINGHDLGRQVQQSYYSGPSLYNPSNNINPGWNPWPWNPIQTGDSFGNVSQVLTNSNDGLTIYVKCIPMQWALNNVPGECTFESWITLAGNTVIVSNRLLNARSDTNQYTGYVQELPAVYTIGTLSNLISYAGNAPFTSDAVTNLPNIPPPWSQWSATESWAAQVNAANWGVGIYNPGAVYFNGGFFGTPGSGGPFDDSTGYIAPMHTEVIDRNIAYIYNYHLILGTLTQIRDWVYAQPYRPGCNSVFQSDRQHWFCLNTTDSGWPLTNNRLRVSLASSDPVITSLSEAFYATNVPKLYIRAAHHIANPAGRATAQVFWNTNGAGGFAPERSATFPLVVDGQYHIYAVNLATNSTYTGLITQLRFDPALSGDPGDYVDVATISSFPLAGTPQGQNVVSNGDFTANAAAFTNWPGYTAPASQGNPASITSWTIITGGGLGVNGPATGASVGTPFSPTNAGLRTYAFIQGGVNGLSQTLALLPSSAYQLDYDVAARAGNTANYEVLIGDSSQLYYAISNAPGNQAMFSHFTATFTNPATLNGTPSIRLMNLTSGDNTVDFANVSLVLLWSGINQAPSFNEGSNQTVLENSGPATVVAWATAISPGPPNESWQNVSFVCSNSNASMFSAPPTVATNGTLTFTPAAYATGSATVTVWAVDNGGTANGGQNTSPWQTFLITVNAPPLAGSDTVFVHWNTTSSLNASNLLANDTDPDGGTLSITATIAGTNTAAVTLTNGFVRYTPVTGFVGNAAFTYLLSDGRGGQATGAVSVVVVSPVITAWALLASNAVHLDFQALPNTAYRLQASTNLIAWRELSTNNTGGDGHLSIDDPTAFLSAIRFYRFVWP